MQHFFYKKKIVFLLHFPLRVGGDLFTGPILIEPEAGGFEFASCLPGPGDPPVGRRPLLAPPFPDPYRPAWGFCFSGSASASPEWEPDLAPRAVS